MDCLGDFQKHAAPWKDHSAVKNLDEQRDLA